MLKLHASLSGHGALNAIFSLSAPNSRESCKDPRARPHLDMILVWDMQHAHMQKRGNPLAGRSLRWGFSANLWRHIPASALPHPEKDTPDNDWECSCVKSIYSVHFCTVLVKASLMFKIFVLHMANWDHLTKYPKLRLSNNGVLITLGSYKLHQSYLIPPGSAAGRGGQRLLGCPVVLL